MGAFPDTGPGRDQNLTEAQGRRGAPGRVGPEAGLHAAERSAAQELTCETSCFDLRKWTVTAGSLAAGM